MSVENFKAALANPLKVPFLVGKRGEGKSQFIKDYAAANLLSFTILNVSAIDEADFTGLPYIDGGLTKYAAPAFLQYDLVFLDELDRVQNSGVKSALLSLFIDRKINGHEFKGQLCAAGNGTTEGNNETSDFDDAFKDRLLIVPFSYTPDQKLKYLESKHGLNNHFLKYCKTKKDLFDDLSTRTIDYAAAFADNRAILKHALKREVFNHYENFLNNLTLTFEDLCAGKSYAFLTSLTKLSLANDLVNNLENLKNMSDDTIKHLNAFVNDLDAEEKAAYFLELKKANQANHIKMNKIILDLNKRGFFKDQGDYAKAVVQ